MQEPQNDRSVISEWKKRTTAAILAGIGFGVLLLMYMLAGYGVIGISEPTMRMLMWLYVFVFAGYFCWFNARCPACKKFTGGILLKTCKKCGARLRV
jgi:hypothetical protein